MQAEFDESIGYDKYDRGARRFVVKSYNTLVA